jgi:hypothetical protein
MIIGWPSAVPIRSATRRPTASEELPAAIGTIMVISRVGYGKASVAADMLKDARLHCRHLVCFFTSCGIEIQEVSESPPKPSSAIAQVPDLIVDRGNLPATAREIRDLFANAGSFFDRGGPVKVVSTGDIGPPIAMALATHRVLQPWI